MACPFWMTFQCNDVPRNGTNDVLEGYMAFIWAVKSMVFYSGGLKSLRRKLDQMGVGVMKYINYALIRYLLSFALCFFSRFKLLMRVVAVTARFSRVLTKLRPETLLIKCSCAHTYAYIVLKICWSWEYVYPRQWSKHVSIWDHHGVMVWCSASVQGLKWGPLSSSPQLYFTRGLVCRVTFLL